MKLIDVDVLKNIIEKINPVDYGSMYSYEAHGAARDLLRDIERILDDIPTVNPTDLCKQCEGFGLMISHAPNVELGETCTFEVKSKYTK